MAADWTVILAALLAAFSLVGLVVAARSLRRSDEELLARLKPSTASAVTEGAARAGLGRRLAHGLARVAQVSGANDAELSQLRRRLVQAGLRGESALQYFLAAKVALALALPAAFLSVNATLPHGVSLAGPIAVWLCVGGFFLPNLWMSSRIASRQLLVERGLPDALDLLVTCVEAGLGLDAALVRVSSDLKISWPLLSSELDLTFLEIKAGIPRTEAFRRLYERTGVDELKSLAATLAQAEMFGTSIAVSLRVQASGLRTRRMYRAEERAAIVAVKMTVPLVLCILPSLLAVVMGPAAVNIYNALFVKMGGN
jgi:tight adherence protein C